MTLDKLGSREMKEGDIFGESARRTKGKRVKRAQ